MRIIVDGYNLIRQWPELAMLDRTDLQEGREGLVRELSAYQRVRRHEITVVFDGQAETAEGGHRAGGVKVRYSRRGETADDVIARLAAESPAGTVVVSSDHEVQAAAKRQGAAAISAREFMTRIESSRMAELKGEEEGGPPVKTGKGTAHRLPKGQRRTERRLKGL
jgi:uncharacterized protein